MISVSKLFRSSLIQSSAIYTIANFANAGVNFILLPVLTRYLSPFDYGLLSMFVMLITFVTPFVGCSIHGAITRRYYSNNGADLRRYVGNCIYILLSSTIIVSFILYFGKELISKYTSIPADWIYLLWVVSAGQFIILIPLAIWQVKVKPLFYGLLQVSQTILNIGISIYMVTHLHMGWQGRILGQVSAVLLLAAVSFIILLRNKWIDWHFDREMIKHALRFSLPLIPHTLGAIIISLTDRVILSNLISIDELGIYTVGLQIASVINLGTVAFNSAYVPWLFGKLNMKENYDRQNIVKYTYLYFVLLIVAFIFLVLVTPYVLKYVVGSAYAGAMPYISWLSLGFIFNGMYLMVTNYLFYAEKTIFLVYLTAITAVVNIPLVYLMINLYGAIGAAISFSLVYFITFIFTWYFSNKAVPMPWLSIKIK